MNDRRSQILEIGVGTVFHTALLFSLFLLFAGHNDPGGGFVGGLVAGAAFVLRYLEGGTGRVDESIRLAPAALLGVGLAVAGGTGVGSLLTGGPLLESAKADLELPVLGEVHTTTSLLFDIGVYLVVVGFVLMVLRTLGGEGEEAGAAVGPAGRRGVGEGR